MTRILLAYTGDGLTHVAIPWLASRHDAEVVTLTLDLGQPVDLAEVRAQALAAGAVRAHVIDAREAWADRVLLPALRAGAVCLNDEDPDPLVGPLASPLVARHVAEVATMEQADAIAHGGTSGRLPPLLASQTRTRVLPSLAEVLTEEDGARIVAEHGGTVAGVQEAPPAPTSHAATVEIDVEQGTPTAVNGVTMPFIELVASLDAIAVSHGVGHGVRSRHAAIGAWRPSAALLSSRAIRELEPQCLGPRLIALRRALAQAYVELLYEGGWFSSARAAIDAFAACALEALHGSVRFELAQGAVRVLEVIPAAERLADRTARSATGAPIVRTMVER